MRAPPSPLSSAPLAFRRRRYATPQSRRSAHATRRFRRRRAAVRCKRDKSAWVRLTAAASARQMPRRPGTRPSVTALACSRTTQCVARCLLAGLAFTQLTTRRHAVRLLLRLALQSSTLSTFQQILTACGGTTITGASCPAPPPGAAPSVPAITAVTLAWAYAVRVNPSTIAVRCHLRSLLTMSAAVRLRSVAERLCFALRFRASFQSTPPSRCSPYAGLLTPPFPLPPPP